jgi:putative ubiquitin-RnfH superfamily antitoxin RatB of RatAB toxin-antitoxin module
VAGQTLSGAGPIEVEVAVAAADGPVVLEVRLPAGSTVAEAIAASGILTQFPGMNLAPHAIGVFGRVVPLSHVLKPGDRVEIYRPLTADPKRLRRERAARVKGTGRTGRNPKAG